MADHKDSNHQKILEAELVKGKSDDAYDRHIAMLEVGGKDYSWRHYDDLVRERKESSGQAVSLGSTFNYSFFKRGEATDYTSGLNEIGQNRQALVDMKKMGVPYSEIERARDLHPDMSLSQMRDSWKAQHTTDGHGRDEYGTSERRNAYFEQKVEQVLAKHPNAEQGADLLDMLASDKIKPGSGGTSPTKVAHAKTQVKHQDKPAEAQAGSYFRKLGEPNTFDNKTSEQMLPADASRMTLQNDNINPGDLGNLKLPMNSYDAQWLNAIREMKANQPSDGPKFTR